MHWDIAVSLMLFAFSIVGLSVIVSVVVMGLLK